MAKDCIVWGDFLEFIENSHWIQLLATNYKQEYDFVCLFGMYMRGDP